MFTMQWLYVLYVSTQCNDFNIVVGVAKLVWADHTFNKYIINTSNTRDKSHTSECIREAMLTEGYRKCLNPVI